jgi:hypothetical protein
LVKRTKKKSDASYGNNKIRETQLYKKRKGHV